MEIKPPPLHLFNLQPPSIAALVNSRRIPPTPLPNELLPTRTVVFSNKETRQAVPHHDVHLQIVVVVVQLIIEGILVLDVGVEVKMTTSLQMWNEKWHKPKPNTNPSKPESKMIREKYFEAA
jgi:hypothetical protein